jgi:hypothetical protein
VRDEPGCGDWRMTGKAVSSFGARACFFERLAVGCSHRTLIRLLSRMRWSSGSSSCSGASDSYVSVPEGAGGSGVGAGCGSSGSESGRGSWGSGYLGLPGLAGPGYPGPAGSSGGTDISVIGRLLRGAASSFDQFVGDLLVLDAVLNVSRDGRPGPHVRGTPFHLQRLIIQRGSRLLSHTYGLP